MKIGSAGQLGQSPAGFEARWVISSISTSPPGGNQVGGLPPVFSNYSIRGSSAVELGQQIDDNSFLFSEFLKLYKFIFSSDNFVWAYYLGASGNIL